MSMIFSTIYFFKKKPENQIFSQCVFVRFSMMVKILHYILALEAYIRNKYIKHFFKIFVYV